MLLYKYQSVTKQTLGNLACRKLWAACPTSFNDPFEYNFKDRVRVKNIEGIRKQLNLADLESTHAHIRHSLDSFEQEKRSRGMVCLSSVPDNIVMWSHYSDGHRGIVLGFDVGPNPLGMGSFVEVKYVHDTYEFEFVIDVVGDHIHIDDSQNNLWGIKYKDWSYEKEWRLLYREGNALRPYPGKLREVIFGMRAPESDIALVRGLLGGEQDISFYKAVQNEGRFGVSMEGPL